MNTLKQELQVVATLIGERQYHPDGHEFAGRHFHRIRVQATSLTKRADPRGLFLLYAFALRHA